MPNYKFTYFAARGRGESIRFIFAQGGAKYEDFRITPDKWPEYKPKMPMGQVPVLEIDGKTLCQSTTIARYLAKEFGLVPESSFDQALCDMYVDGVNDLYPAIRPFFMDLMGMGDNKKDEHWKKFMETFNQFLDKYEKFLATNGSGYLVGKKLTWADIFVGEFTNRIVDLWEPAALKGHPKVEAHMKMVIEQPNIKKYIATRPETKL